jgi:hypothetical protein
VSRHVTLQNNICVVNSTAGIDQCFIWLETRERTLGETGPRRDRTFPKTYVSCFPAELCKILYMASNGHFHQNIRFGASRLLPLKAVIFGPRNLRNTAARRGLLRTYQNIGGCLGLQNRWLYHDKQGKNFVGTSPRVDIEREVQGILRVDVCDGREVQGTAGTWNLWVPSIPHLS